MTRPKYAQGSEDASTQVENVQTELKNGLHFLSEHTAPLEPVSWLPNSYGA